MNDTTQDPASTQNQDDTGEQTEDTGTQKADDLTALEQELNETKQKLEEMTAISQRALADLQNFKRRSEEERANYATFANAALFNELIPVIDNASRALDHEGRDEEWAKGAEQTLNQLIKTTEKLGLHTIPTDVPFDPTMHEALMTGPGDKDAIIEVLEKGYMMGEKVIKMARVKVGNGETAES